MITLAKEIINGRAGKCSENCKFCAQSAHHHTNCDEYSFLANDPLLEGCAHAHDNGVNRYSIVTAGRTMEGADLEKALEAYPDMILCASHGLMKAEDLKKLSAVGVSMYHANVETSANYFSDGGKVLFESGANATLTGDMLTTVGNNTTQDREMLEALGFSLKEKPALHV